MFILYRKDNRVLTFENVSQLGTPYAADDLEWAKAASVCGLRLVNAYNTGDWLLATAYRATLGDGLQVPGLGAVPYIHGSEANCLEGTGI